MNLDNQFFEATGAIPQITLDGKYQIDGKILVLPITGSGRANITFCK